MSSCDAQPSYLRGFHSNLPTAPDRVLGSRKRLYHHRPQLKLEGPKCSQAICGDRHGDSIEARSKPTFPTRWEVEEYELSDYLWRAARRGDECGVVRASMHSSPQSAGLCGEVYSHSGYTLLQVVIPHSLTLGRTGRLSSLYAKYIIFLCCSF
ncbi:hypothetical protein J6590_014101 [Homalodisca vitripennis]|nr:hypothetical protein J6590_014101 [Homalodisca vitripennis]